MPQTTLERALQLTDEFEIGEVIPDSAELELSERDLFDIERVDSMVRGLADKLSAAQTEDEHHETQWQINHECYRLVVGNDDRHTPRRQRRYPLNQVGMDYLIDSLGALETEYPGYGVASAATQGCLVRFDKISEAGDFDEQLALDMFDKLWASRETPSGHFDRSKLRFARSLAENMLVPLVLDDGSSESPVSDNLRTVWSDPEFLSGAVGIFIEGYEKATAGIRVSGTEHAYTDYEKELIDKIFSGYGFHKNESAEVRRAWRSVADTKEIKLHQWTPNVLSSSLEVERRPDYIRAQMKAMAAIGVRSAHAPAELFRRFGIRNFGRYQPGELIEQLAQGYAETDTLCVSATDDWNTAFGNTGIAIEQLGFGSVTHVEAATQAELLRHLVRRRKSAGPLKSLIIQAHGSPRGFVLGDARKRRYSSITKELLESSKSVSRFVESGLIAPDAQIILYSCETGVDDGIAEKITLATGVEVIAPESSPRGMLRDPEGEVRFRDLAGGSGSVIYEHPGGAAVNARRTVRR